MSAFPLAVNATLLGVVNARLLLTAHASIRILSVSRCLLWRSPVPAVIATVMVIHPDTASIVYRCCSLLPLQPPSSVQPS
eukprot:255383-Pleurochrysis_carterae.AAC.1